MKSVSEMAALYRLSSRTCWKIECAFAAIRSDGAIVAWGDPRRGGDCSAVREQLHCARAIQAMDYAFAATRSDNVVITWSLAEYGEWRCREPAGVSSASLFKMDRRHSGLRKMFS